MGPKLMNCCKPEDVGTKEHGKMLKRIQVLEDGRVLAKKVERQRRPHPSFGGTDEPSPSFLRSSRLANRLATFLAARPSFLGTPTNGFCLPQSGQFSLLCWKSQKILLPLLLACVRIYLRQTSESSGSIRSSNASISTFISSLWCR